VSVAEVQGKDQLVAFCIFNGDHQPGSAGPLPAEGGLEKVKELMPKLTTISHYMMPAVFLPFGSFPTLPSGKANRKELVAMVKRMQKTEIAGYIPMDETEGDFQPVSTEQEIVMQKAWATVLDESEESIGANSAFLALGGDSISAINVVAACRKLSYAITVANILSNPTLAEQAKYLKAMGKKEPLKEVRFEIPQSVSSALSRSNVDVDRDVEVIYPAGPGQIEFLTQGHTKHQFWSLTACRDLPQGFDFDHWVETTKALTARNQIMRTMYFQASNDAGSWYQIVLKESALNWEQIFYSTETEKVRYMEELRDSLFQFGKPNIKYRLLESLVDGSRTLCIKVDHGSYDGTLLRIFDEQFTALARGESNLPAVHDFRQFVNWIHRSDRKTALQYWKKSLGDYQPAHKLALQPVTDRLKFAEVKASVDATASQWGVTASTVFQAAYSLVAGQLSGTNDVIVDNLLTGRNADVENPQLLNGACANFLPFRQRLQGSESVHQFLKDTQDLFWDTTEHGTVGLHDIYQALGQDRQVYSSKML
jgi:aryl carrier-like protein